MLVRASVCECVEPVVGAEGGHGACAVRKGCKALLPAAYCLGVCLFAATATTAGSEISGMGVAVVGGFYVSVDFAAIVLCTSQARSIMWFKRLELYYLSWLRILFD